MPDLTFHNDRAPAAAPAETGSPLTGQLQEFCKSVAALPADHLTETLARWAAAQYAAAACRETETAGHAGLPLETLQSLTVAIVALRKGDHSAARLQLERDRLDLERENLKERQEQLFEQWLQQPEVQARFRGGLSEEERARRVRDILGD